MVFVAQVSLAIALSYLLVRYLPLTIRLGALLLLAMVMVFLCLVAWPVIGPARWVRRLRVREAEHHSSSVGPRALDQPGRRIPHSG